MSLNITDSEKYISITEEKIDLLKMYNFIQCNEHGAIATFIGSIRNFNLNKNVISVSYDVYEELAIESFKEIINNCKKLFESETKFKIYLEHFKGSLEPAAFSVAIGVSSVHRLEALEAVQFIIEELKHEAPIWKQEHYEHSCSQWIKGHSLCKKSQPRIKTIEHNS